MQIRLKPKTFKEWLVNKGLSKKHVKDIVCYAQKYCYVLEKGCFDELNGLAVDKRRKVLAALSNLSKFLGCYNRFKLLKERSGLKWSERNGIDVFKRLYEDNGKDVVEWLLDVKSKLNWSFYFPIAFMALTGLRPNEAILSLNLIANNGLDGYYNAELNVLEHFRFKEFLRATKHAYISIITPTLHQYLKQWHQSTSYNTLRCKLRRLGLAVKLYDLRSWYATTLRNAGIPSEFIDLIQGRIGPSIFTRHYYRPSIQALSTQIINIMEPISQQLLSNPI